MELQAPRRGPRHRFPVVDLLLKVPFARPYWASAVVVVIIQPRRDWEEYRRRYRASVRSTMPLLYLLHRWFPDRIFLVRVDDMYSKQELARFA